MTRASAARVRAVVWIGTAWLAAAPASAQTEGEGVRLSTDAVEIGIGGRVQTQLRTTTVEGEPESELFLRRARLEVDVRVNDLVSGTVQPDFAGDEVSLKDVYLQLDLAPALRVRTGKFYRPFSVFLLTSSTRILPIERGAVIPGIQAWDQNELVDDLHYGDRDIGVELSGAPEGAPLGLAYAAGVFRGPAHQVGDDATYQYVARATVAPVDDLRLGAAWSNRAYARSTAFEGPEIERGSAWEVDVELGTFDRGLHLLGEVALGDFDPFEGSDFLGAQAWLAYRTAPAGRLSGIEPLLRVSHGDVGVDEEALGERPAGGTLLTPGLNLYLGGRNRLMFNYDHWIADGDADDQGSFKAMFQLAF